MKIIGYILLIIVAILVWRLGERLSTDALGLAIGIIFGCLAGIPGAILVLAANRQRDRHEPPAPVAYHQPPPPIIIVAGDATRHPAIESGEWAAGDYIDASATPVRHWR